MPRRWRRKGEVYIPSLPELLRDAQPTYADIKGEPDPHKRRERERARDRATDELLKLFWAAAKRGKVEQLDLRVRGFCEALKSHNGGRLPKAKGGAPPKEHQRLLVAISVLEEIEAAGKTRGRVELALREVAKRFRLSYDHVRDIYYDRDPHWRRLVRTEVARRKLEAGAKYDTAEG